MVDKVDLLYNYSDYEKLKLVIKNNLKNETDLENKKNTDIFIDSVVKVLKYLHIKDNIFVSSNEIINYLQISKIEELLEDKKIPLIIKSDLLTYTNNIIKQDNNLIDLECFSDCFSFYDDEEYKEKEGFQSFILLNKDYIELLDDKTKIYYLNLYLKGGASFDGVNNIIVSLENNKNLWELRSLSFLSKLIEPLIYLKKNNGIKLDLNELKKYLNIYSVEEIIKREDIPFKYKERLMDYISSIPRSSKEVLLEQHGYIEMTARSFINNNKYSNKYNEEKIEEHEYIVKNIMSSLNKEINNNV